MEHDSSSKKARSVSVENHVLRSMALLIGFLFFSQVWGTVWQNGIRVTGVVQDSNKELLIGATVRVKGTTLGTITDVDGKFTITVPNAKSVLEVSYVGYNPKEIPLNGQNQVIIVLEEDQNTLEEVVVVGYGTQKKESVVGAITQIDNKALVEAGTTNITNALTGKLSGVMTIQTSGQPGSNNAEIIIRGVSSWNGSGPLVLVDGVERDFTDLDPNEVETVSVLKDASATAVFGARGANGVIIVTTKEGRVGDPKFSATVSHGISWATRVPEHVGAEITLNSYNEKLMNEMKFDKIVPQSDIQKHVNPSSPLESILYPDINWYDLLTKDFAHVTNANVNLRGGTDFINYFCSLGFNHETSLFDAYQGQNKYHNANYDYKRVNFRTNLDFKLTKTTTIKLKVGGDVDFENTPGNEPWEDIFGTSGVNYPAYYPAWMLEEYPDLYYPGMTGDRLANVTDAPFPVKRKNPYTMLHGGSFERRSAMMLFSDLIFNQKLDFITKGLSFQAKVAFNTRHKYKPLGSSYNQMLWSFHPEYLGTDRNPWERKSEDEFFWHEVPEPGLSVGGLTNYNNSLNYEFALNYKRNFGNHYVTGLALMNRNIENVTTEYPYLYESWVGRITYDYAHKYLLEVNMGYTGSERFSPNNRFGFFPSGAIGWVVSEEKFFKENVSWISKLKFRYSDGLVGSDNANSRWLYISEFSRSGSNIVEDKGANLYAQWEEARKQDFGIELGFFDNDLTLNVDLFKEKRENILLSPRYNFLVANAFKDLNKGRIKKHGYEVEIGYRHRTQYGLSYGLKGMLSFSENRILERDDLPYAPDYMKQAGKPFGSKTDGQITIDGNFFNSIDESHIYPSTQTSSYLLSLGSYKYLDYNSDGVIDKNDLFCINGSNYAPYVFSLSGEISYKNFAVSMLWSGNIGKYVTYRRSFFAEFPDTEVKLYENMVDHWTPDNHDATHNGMGTQNIDLGKEAYMEGFNWQRANYIKLTDLNVSYRFKSKALDRALGIRQIKVFFTGHNLLLFTELPTGDPESKIFDYGSYPQMASARLGLNIDF